MRHRNMNDGYFNIAEDQYLEILTELVNHGVPVNDRTGVGTRASWAKMIQHDMSEGFPIITTRKIAFRIAFEETMFFLRGDTDTRKLEEKKIKIWQGNTTREFLDDRGLTHLPEGSMGKGYSFQWRNFNGKDPKLGDWHPEPGVDQIKNLLEGLKESPTSRRHLVTAWNPSQLSETPLPPCHIMHQYQVLDGQLNSMWFQRSADMYHGVPYNLMSYSFLNMLFAKYLGLKPGVVVGVFGDAHVYENQLSNIFTQLERDPYGLPELTIEKELNSLDDILSLEYSDISIENYDCYPALPKVEMAV